ncbi:MAG TPA: hypothetical protein VGD21_10385 [Lysobacter sp.]
MSNIFKSRAKLKTGALALALAVAAITGVGAAAAQDFTVGWSPRTGDVWVDTYLTDMNRYGSRYREPFIDELVRYHGAPRPLVVELIEVRRWAPGDVYYACAIASIIGRPCRYVIDEYDRDRGQGWGNIAKRMGIKPGSPEFHRLKRGFVPTYDRWARPITLDVDLRNDFPNRGKGQGGPRAKGGSGKGKAVDHGGGHGKGSAKKGNTAHGGSAKGSDHGPGHAAKGGGKGQGQGKGGSKKGGEKGNGKGKG